ncbi:pyocin activator PrtN family protein [Serratia liquefaciens]|uniref:pyocin activator PrtN family protein n=1 Tax=Serratia liquefaciens TaxID=614 RepID=UPI00061B7AB3|nr:pyocin activator PrtN family protein [Serratia liquefaciens]AKE12895.1 pyocin activator protein PrtN, phage related protein [Serratia liquefaciens]
MNTTFLLMAEYETAVIPLSQIAEKYLGMRPATAENKALIGQLSIATFRVGDTQKAPRMVHISDLAEHIDQRRAEAKKELLRMK